MRPAPVRLATALLAAAAASLPLFAAAHTGADAGAHHGLGFAAGLAHPFTGADHLFVMLAVGVWSALAMRGAKRWVAPIGFAAMLLAGALVGLAGVALPAVEPMIAASRWRWACCSRCGAACPPLRRRPWPVRLRCFTAWRTVPNWPALPRPRSHWPAC